MTDQNADYACLFEVHVDFADGSRASYDGLELWEVSTIVDTFNAVPISECSISPTQNDSSGAES